MWWYYRIVIDRKPLVRHRFAVHFCIRMLDQIFQRFKSEVFGEAIRRQEKGGLFFVQELRKAIKAATTVSSGSQGSLLSIISDTKATTRSIVTRVGFSTAVDYIKYRLFGVKPAAGAFYPAMTTIPPLEKIKKWIEQSNLDIPVSNVFGVALSIKNKGREPLQHKSGGNILETVFNQKKERLQQILQGVS
jgi:hypothetical protein